MKSDRKPQTSGAPQCQAEEEADECRRQKPKPAFSSIPTVNKTENRGQHDGRWPETDPPRQGELQVAAEQKFFEEADHQEKDCPERRESHNSVSGQHDVAKVVSVQAKQNADEQAYRGQSPANAHPERASESPLRRQTVRAPSSAFHSRQHERWNYGCGEIATFFEQPRPQAAGAEV